MDNAIKAAAERMQERQVLVDALRAIVDQEQHDGDAETHMHDMADIARAALAELGQQ